MPCRCSLCPRCTQATQPHTLHGYYSIILNFPSPVAALSRPPQVSLCNTRLLEIPIPIIVASATLTAAIFATSTANALVTLPSWPRDHLSPTNSNQCLPIVINQRRLLAML